VGFLSDPSYVDPGILAWFFLAFMLVVLPGGAFRTYRLLTSGPDGADRLPSRTRVYLSTMVLEAVLVVMSWAVATDSGIRLFPPTSVGTWEVGVGAVALLLGLVVLLPGVPITSEEGRRRVGAIAPRSPREHVLFYALSATAALGEEMAYRGVLFMLLAVLTGSWWLAALICALAFGAGHLAQGPRSAAVVVLFGIRDHVVVGLTGTLTVMIVIHFIHDVVAGTVAGARMRRMPPHLHPSSTRV
jgi:membrane protease YdiL (CAAX protease family)